MHSSDIPNDSDGDAMRRVLGNGSDPSKPMKIDFQIAVPNESAGKRVSEAARAKGYDVELESDEETGDWTCYCSRVMLLNHAALVQCQAELDLISAPFDGYSDGWGTFGNT